MKPTASSLQPFSASALHILALVGAARAWVPNAPLTRMTRPLFSQRHTIALSLSSSSESTQTQGTQAAAGPSTIVTVDLRLVPEGDFIPEPLIDGVCLHKDDPSVELSFVLGQGNYLPGLHTLVEGMNVGDSVEGVSMDAGWGSHNPQLVVTLKFADAGVDPSQIQVGTQLYLSANRVTATVTKVTDETFTMDANPPLAGASYAASVTLKDRIDQGPSMAEGVINAGRYQVATFALGCFWGGELEFMREPGVVGTSVGYTQGQLDHPTYEQVCSGTTGHTEAIAVVYDSDKVSYERLVHLAMDRLGEDKYMLNQVGNDKGTQYRHGIYYHSPEQLETAKKILDGYGEDCVTECLPASTYWVAEDYHQQYLLKGGQSARKSDKTTIRCYG